MTPRRSISFCFDDGFLRSSEKVAGLFASYGVKACFAVLAAPQESEDPFIRQSRIADWPHWREFARAGHEIAPHGWAHENLLNLSLAEAAHSIERTWQLFESELPGFDRRTSVFHAAYMRMPAELLQWTSARALAVRVATGGGGANFLSSRRRGGVVDCACFGPGCVDEPMRMRLASFLAGRADWLTLVFHGIGDEGWGPVSLSGLEYLLSMATDNGLRIETPNRLILEGLQGVGSDN